MISFRQWWPRLVNSAVVWSWVLNVCRLASGLLLLPLLLRLLTTEDLGMYYVLLSLNTLGMFADFGFVNSISRSVGFAMSGATHLRSEGFVAVAAGDTKPNLPLLWKLLYTTRTLYGGLAVLMAIVLGAIGTVVVGYRVDETSSPQLTWIAWGLTLGVTVFELYSMWWNWFLRGLNEVLLSTRLMVIAYAVKLGLSCAFLVAGFALMSVPLAGLISGLLLRFLSRRACLQRLAGESAVRPSVGEVREVLGILWPNTWRLGLQLMSGYLMTNANALICLKYFGLAANAQYGLSVQLVTIITGMASVWVAVKWPIIVQMRARNDTTGMQRIVWQRVWLQNLTYILMAAVTIALGPPILTWIASDKTVLPRFWLALLALQFFLDMQLSFWTALISTQNRMPFLRTMVATHATSLLLALIFIQLMTFKLGALVVAPLVAGLILVYWYWPLQGAKSIQTELRRFMLSKPVTAK